MNPILHRVIWMAYVVLFVAASFRSGYQLLTKFSDAPVTYILSAVAAVLYGFIALALWKNTARGRSFALYGTYVELVGVLAVGTIEIVNEHAWPDQTVWSGYGSGYGYIPVVLPIIAIVSLMKTRSARSGDANREQIYP